ncbi:MULTISPECIES: hypothetical protein [Microbispora]|uniref:Uncharacterized protein n=2 Tax=Microbispora TaxID=2005 RepID=A0ABY3LMK6_9ACTN|nr:MULTISPECIES: hypothetical protein [Microbispora]TLP60752.1 hypothetical protein FED44_12815 [Microbispora fusca]TYB42656.1 hypothetical protein FXF59_34315 [Microbispora tritici]GLW25780.1 hypothetical protein Mame01_58220 [Microbispora amethystogenes]
MGPIRLTPAHKMMASAVLVSLVILGGASVTAAAFAARLDKVVQNAPAAKLGPTPTEDPQDPSVVSRVLTDDPEQVGGYWTPERLEDASPMPVPELSINIVTPND